MGTDDVPLICYFDGELQHNTSNPIYVGGHIKADRVRKNVSFMEFVTKMHELCKSPPEDRTIYITCRYLLDQHNSIAMHVEDDNSLSIIMDLHPHQCNAIVVYIEKRPEKKSSTTRRHEKGSSSSGAGGGMHMASTPVKGNASQLISNSFDNIDSLVIDIYSSPSKDSSSVPRYGKPEMEKELERSSGSKLQVMRSREYKTTSANFNEQIELNDPNEELLKSKEENTDSSVLRSPDLSSNIYSKSTRQLSRNDIVHFESSSTNSSSWFRMGVLDPKDIYLQRWNKIFILCSILALALDALFFYTPGFDGKMSCLNWDKNLEITACVLRSITDSIYVLHIIFQFRTGFFAPSSRVFGRGEFVEDLGVIARRYLSSFFLIDILAVLPLPQVLILIIMPKMSGLIDVRKRNSLRYVVLLQYIPRFLRIYPLYKELRRANVTTKTAWAGVVFNFSLYMLASHIFGALWYFLSVERETICWRDACRNVTTCNVYSLYCGDHNTGGNEFLQTSCPIIEPNTTLFDFGIYLDALQSGISKSSFLEKSIYCFWWGLQNIGSFGQNLKTSAYVWEVCFAVSISVFGLFLFMLLIGNVQTYLQSETVRSEKEFRKKLRDTERWMSRKFLPEDLRQRIRQFELFIWQTTRGFDEENLLRILPKDIKRDIKRHICLALLVEVPEFGKMDEHFLDALCDRLKPVLYTEDNFIIWEGHPLDEMLFIMSGELLSVTSNGGNTANFSSYLKAGDFIGEELLPWAILSTNSSNPLSTRTVQALKKVEAFALTAVDLKLVISQFRLQRKQLHHSLRFYSQQWRKWAAIFIQATWRRYCKKKLEKSLGEKKKIFQDQLARTGGSKPSLGATIHASRFAANALRSLSIRKARRLTTRQIQKPGFFYNHQLCFCVVMLSRCATN